MTHIKKARSRVLRCHSTWLYDKVVWFHVGYKQRWPQNTWKRSRYFDFTHDGKFLQNLYRRYINIFNLDNGSISVSVIKFRSADDKCYINVCNAFSHWQTFCTLPIRRRGGPRPYLPVILLNYLIRSIDINYVSKFYVNVINYPYLKSHKHSAAVCG